MQKTQERRERRVANPDRSNCSTSFLQLSKFEMGSHVASHTLYPFQATKYSTVLRDNLFAKIFSTSNSGSSTENTGARTGGTGP